jgi:V/A-type H+-transporting ATPase subunit K
MMKGAVEDLGIFTRIFTGESRGSLQGGEMMKLKVLFILWFLLLCAPAFAQETGQGHEAAASSSKGLIAIAMGLAVGLGAIGTAIAQARIGAAGVGSVAEKPESFGMALIFFLLPETLVIFGLVVAFLLFGKL